MDCAEDEAGGLNDLSMNSKCVRMGRMLRPKLCLDKQEFGCIHSPKVNFAAGLSILVLKQLSK